MADNNVSTYSGAEGRGGATILQPADFSNLFAQNINTMRAIRSMQDKVEADKQKDLSDMLNIKLPEEVWNQTEQELSEMLNGFIEDASKTYAKHETNYGYKIPASEQLRLKNMKSEIARYAASSVTARESIQKVFDQARADKNADLESLNQNLNAEILYAKNKTKEQGGRWLNYFRPETITFNRESEPYNWIEVKPDITETTGFTPGKIGDESGVITVTTKTSNTSKAIKTSFNDLKTKVIKGDYSAKKEMSVLDAMAVNEGYKSAEDAINSGKENAVSTYIIGQSKIQNINETNKSFSRNPEDNNGSYSYKKMIENGVISFSNSGIVYTKDAKGNVVAQNAEHPIIAAATDGKPMTLDLVSSYKDRSTGTWQKGNTTLSFDYTPSIEWFSLEKGADGNSKGMIAFVGTSDSKPVSTEVNSKGMAKWLLKVGATRLQGAEREQFVEGMITEFRNAGADDTAIQRLESLLRSQGFVAKNGGITTTKTTTNKTSGTTDNKNWNVDNVNI